MVIINIHKLWIMLPDLGLYLANSSFPRAAIKHLRKEEKEVLGVWGYFSPRTYSGRDYQEAENYRIRCQADKILSSIVTKKGSTFKPPMPQALNWNPKLLYTLGIGWTRSINWPVFKGTEWTLLDCYLRVRGAKLVCMKMASPVFQVFMQFFVHDQI